MNHPPYSFDEAQKLSATYAFIKGSFFGSADEKHLIVEQLVVCPFDEIAVNKFIMYLRLVPDANAVLTEVYSGLLYNVLVVGVSKLDPNEIRYLPLYDWAQNRGFDDERTFKMAELVKGSLKGSQNDTIQPDRKVK